MILPEDVFIKRIRHSYSVFLTIVYSNLGIYLCAYIGWLCISFAAISQGQTVSLSVSNLAGLKAAKTANYPDGVWRLSFGNGNGAHPLFFRPSPFACLVEGGKGDNGSQVPSADGKCWLAVFPASGLDVRQFGALGDGKTDSTEAVQKCLNAAIGATCGIGSDAKDFRLYLASRIFIPTQTTFTCNTPWPDTGDGAQRFNTQTAILTGGNPGIVSGGYGATYRNCLQLPHGMKFPVSGMGTPRWQGTGVADGGGTLSLIELEIIGYDTCVDLGAFRPYVRRLFLDCTGESHAAFYDHIGNSDAGFIDEIEISPFATGNVGEIGATCAGAARPGKGFLFEGMIYAGRVFAQNFLIANYDIRSEMTADLINSDDAAWLGSAPEYCLPIYRGVGVNLGTGAQLQVATMLIQGAGVGLRSVPGFVGLTSQIANLWFNSVVGDCIQFGSVSATGGVLLIGTLATNQSSGEIANCGAGSANQYTGYMINWFDAGEGVLRISSADVRGINNSVIGSKKSSAPFFSVAAGIAALGNNFIIGNLSTDLDPGSNPYSGRFTVSATGNEMMRGIPPSNISCTGYGRTGGCHLRRGSDIVAGAIILNTGGGDEESSGQIDIAFPFEASNFVTCNFQYADRWLRPVTAMVQQVLTTRSMRVYWSNGRRLDDQVSYQVGYSCSYR